ncbi:sulfite exporter TauE/SafE family protein [Cyanobacterium stanieri LEGE 03274]|uniref:Probable membrane transporter protein n=1 Tax=Cyanobacterium stanieri LEGE 03274 TaxID=1828756 RepID=A0ABR9V639_9CHRO|nr:sulfite exporter TauE/SafE family protein [Cyanobacterium stanieri]MBE9223348.1 sulfite exporter TauE/SafE family protein [Cyanobacterium stanieri LEGE 03274]
MRLTFGLILAIIIGLSLGLIGGGGSILAVPILRYVMGVEPRSAIAMSLFIVGTVSIIGIIPHWRQGNVNLPVAISFIPPAMVGSFLGAKITQFPFITDTVQLVAFGIVMLLASILMIKKSSAKTSTKELEKTTVKVKTISKNKTKKIILTITEGLVVGILTGFVGVGGGFLIIPALVLVGGIPMKEAVGTSLLIIAAKSASAFMGYLTLVNIDWILTIGFTFAATVGIISGSYLSKIIDAKYLQKGFGYFVLVVAIFVLIAR